MGNQISPDKNQNGNTYTVVDGDYNDQYYYNYGTFNNPYTFNNTYTIFNSGKDIYGPVDSSLNNTGTMDSKQITNWSRLNNSGTLYNTYLILNDIQDKDLGYTEYAGS